MVMRKLSVFSAICLLLAFWLIQCGEDGTISPPGEAQLVDYSHGECDLELAGSHYTLESDSADVEITIDGLEVTVIHRNAILNCCLDSIPITFSQEGNLLKLTETESTSQPCLCLCPYVVEATIMVPSSGTYVIEVYTLTKLVWREEIFIPGR
jgi:hypothetical protein